LIYLSFIFLLEHYDQDRVQVVVVEWLASLPWIIAIGGSAPLLKAMLLNAITLYLLLLLVLGPTRREKRNSQKS